MKKILHIHPKYEIIYQFRNPAEFEVLEIIIQRIKHFNQKVNIIEESIKYYNNLFPRKISVKRIKTSKESKLEGNRADFIFVEEFLEKEIDKSPKKWHHLEMGF